MSNNEVVVESPELNDLWRNFLETNTLWFMMKEIPEEFIERMSCARFEKLNKYMDDLGTGEGVLYWRVILSFRYKDEGFSLDSQETEPEWYVFDWQNNVNTTEDLEWEIDEYFTGKTPTVILNYFLETVLDEKYDLNIK